MGSLVPRRLYGTAVGRNYARRRLREFYRRNRSLFPEGSELIVRLYARPDDWDALLATITAMLGRARRKLARNGSAAASTREPGSTNPRTRGRGKARAG